jgi:hypothetical protein
VQFINVLRERFGISIDLRDHLVPLYTETSSFLGAIIPMRGWDLFPKHSEQEVIDALIDLIDSGLTRRS